MTETPGTDDLRNITLRRTALGAYEATNDRGATLAFGQGDDLFSPVDLLLAAIAGCTSIDVDHITSRRAEPARFEVTAAGVKVQDDHGHHLTDLHVTFDVRFPEGKGGDAARARLPQAIARSHDHLCTVSRTVELGTPVTMTAAG